MIKKCYSIYNGKVVSWYEEDNLVITPMNSFNNTVVTPSTLDTSTFISSAKSKLHTRLSS